MNWTPDIGWIYWSFRNPGAWLRIPLVDEKHFVMASAGIYFKAYQQGEDRLFTGVHLSCFSKSMRLGWWTKRVFRTSHS